jgi:hypothetical protein
MWGQWQVFITMTAESGTWVLNAAYNRIHNKQISNKHAVASMWHAVASMWHAVASVRQQLPGLANAACITQYLLDCSSFGPSEEAMIVTVMYTHERPAKGEGGFRDSLRDARRDGWP